MNIRFGRQRKIRFTDKKHPTRGVISFLIAVVSLIFMISLFIGSSRAAGNGGIAYGYLGLLNFAIAVAGFVMALRCYKLEDIYMTTPAIGSVVNGCIALIYLFLYFLGVL